MKWQGNEYKLYKLANYYKPEPQKTAKKKKIPVQGSFKENRNLDELDKSPDSFLVEHDSYLQIHISKLPILSEKRREENFLRKGVANEDERWVFYT